MVEAMILGVLFLVVCAMVGYMVTTSDRRFEYLDKEKTRHEQSHWSKYKYW